MNPNDLRFSQRSAGGSGRAEELRESLITTADHTIFATRNHPAFDPLTSKWVPAESVRPGMFA
jgi:hypothetical protein